MAHITYKTDGIVLGKASVGESDQYITLFTRELGLVRAHARSTRKERSKLRYHLQELTRGEFLLVRGKNVWRVIGARSSWNSFYTFREDLLKTALVRRYLRLLKRLLQGEGEQRELFSLVEEGFIFLRDESLDEDLLQNFEYLLVLRTLLLLGYVGERDALSGILHTHSFDKKTLVRISPLRRAAVLEINRALRESQL